jgi:hypothetical protein
VSAWPRKYLQIARTHAAVEWTAGDSALLFKVSPQWRVLRGTAYGLQQPAVLGSVRVKLPSDYEFRALDQAMVELLEEKYPTQRSRVRSTG